MPKQYTLVDSVSIKHAKIAIKKFVGDNPNMGLKEYNMAVHDNIKHTDCVMCTADGQTKTYKTGLNEQDFSITSLDKEEKEAKIKSIRMLVARAENTIAGNYDVNPEDPDIATDKDFWRKVKMFKSVVPDVFNNKGVRIKTYWDDFNIVLSNDGIILNENDVKHQLMAHVIEAGGFTSIAPDYESAASNSRGRYKFYLDKRQDTSAIKVTDRLLRDKAGMKLVAMLEEDANKLFYITKLVTTESLYFKTGKNQTPNNFLYDECCNFVDGLTERQRNKTLACEEFLKLAAMKLSELKAMAVIHDAEALSYIVTKDGKLYHVATGTILGKNMEEAVQFMTAIANETVSRKITDSVLKEWDK